MNFEDIIYGHITLPIEIRYIIDTIPFQRLRYIKQLGMVHYLYPCANHTRFEHSIGVAYLCYNLMKKLQLKQPELNITDRDSILVSVAGLIHDIGHACFSHFFDDKLMNKMNINHPNYFLKHHEARSEYIFKKIVKDYNLEYTENEIDLICEYINPKIHNIKEKNIDRKFRYEIVSNYISGFDCDKLDYLVRDSHYLGNRVDLNVLTLLDNAIVIDDNICYPKNMMINVYSVYHSRFLFHKKYYGNDTTRCIEYMIYDAMLKSSLFNNIEDILDKDDFYNFTDNILQMMLMSNQDCSIIIKNIYNRNLYRIINETSINIDDEEILKKIINKFNDFLELNDIKDDFIFDITKINYGKGKDNPIEFIKFYKNKNTLYIPNKKILKTTPLYYEEILFRIIGKCNKPDKKFYNNLKSNDEIIDNDVINNEISMELLGELMMIIVNDIINSY